MRIVVFIMNAVIQLAAAAAGLLFLLLGMNGYSEDQATPGLVFYIALSAGSALGLGGASAFWAKRLVTKKSFSGFGASAIAVTSCAILGGFILVGGFLMAFVLAEVVRGMK